ncbi:MAG TPA: FAD-binding oxidoreductase [Gaiellales bacterium]|jgi:glycine/D-amino acid oxidase-like deaminating enzyme|nr:FAD-binding oxidoreductase [Gaiellales bacterium]
MADLPDRVKYLVIGAGVHGLSSAWHLAKEQRARGEEPDVLIVDKTGIGAGASGIACGVVRNNYFQPAMSELMAANVEVWEQDPPGFSYHPVGYVALGCGAQVDDLTAVYERQQRIGYPSELIVGAAAVRSHMKEMFPDWRAQGVEVCLHEEKGGYANNMASMQGLAKKAQEAGARLVTGVTVTGFDMDDSGAVKTVQTDQGDIAVEQVVVGVGPWIASLWEMLGLSDRIDVRTPEGDVHKDQEMWTYWYLQEGEISVDPKLLSLPDGSMPPVLHVDSDAPLYDDDGKLITDELWGNYFKQDPHGVQGGAAPIIVGHEFEVDPYPTASVESSFADMWCASLSHCMERFEGKRGTYANVRSGGVGCFTADSFPIFDYMRPNVYVIADSNHGYKMIGVGREVAQVMTGGHSSVLYPFRYERFATGDLHPVSNSPYPWS